MRWDLGGCVQILFEGRQAGTIAINVEIFGSDRLPVEPEIEYLSDLIYEKKYYRSD